jgi:hypothetical protein
VACIRLYTNWARTPTFQNFCHRGFLGERDPVRDCTFFKRLFRISAIAGSWASAIPCGFVACIIMEATSPAGIRISVSQGTRSKCECRAISYQKKKSHERERARDEASVSPELLPTKKKFHKSVTICICMHVCMDVCMYVCVCVCVYVYTHIYIYI